MPPWLSGASVEGVAPKRAGACTGKGRARSDGHDGASRRPESCRFRWVLVTTSRLQRLMRGAFPGSAGGVSARQVAIGGSIDTAAHHRDRRAASAMRKGVLTARRLANVDSQAVTSHRKVGIESIKGVLGRESCEL
jgi:hypothetical protein